MTIASSEGEDMWGKSQYFSCVTYMVCMSFIDRPLLLQKNDNGRL